MVKGFSIEGFFTDKLDERPQEPTEEDLAEMEALSLLEDFLSASGEVKLESYNDYPESASNNAKRS